MKTVCFIPARGGSVRIPRKNIRMFHGKPILAYSIENAQKCGLFDEIIVSTDDHEIDHIARRYGARVIRRETDDGSTGTQELAGAYLQMRRDVGVCCVLYATAPLLHWLHIANGWQMFLSEAGGRPYAHTVHAETHDDVGGFYWGFAQAFREALPLEDRSLLVRLDPRNCCDINTEEDWQRAESMYEALRRAS